MEKYQIGDMLRPFPGGGSYGKCLKCMREGLRITEIPKVEPIPPKGWRNIPVS